MTRLIIIDHDKHEAYIEDVTEEDLKPYNGSEQEYIMDNYGFDEDYFFFMGLYYRYYLL